MSRNTKIILAVIAGVLVLLCLCVGGLALAASLFFINYSTDGGDNTVRSVIEEAVPVDPGWLGAGAADALYASVS